MKKQKLKKAAALAVVVSTVFAVTACGSKADDSSSKAEKIRYCLPHITGNQGRWNN